MSATMLLTFNAGSSTVKIGLFRIEAGGPARIARGMIDFRQKPLALRISGSSELIELSAGTDSDPAALVSETFEALANRFDMDGIAAAGHRIVHGGDRFDGPVAIDDGTIGELDALTTLAPLHQPQGLRLIRAIRDIRPDLRQAASFDTAFHRTNADVVRRFAIPRAFHEQGIKRYGFHGLSYKYIAGEVARRAPETAQGKVVVAHLGSGASLCAIEDGESRDTSMGFSTLDGVPMATRCGALDPGVLLHLLGAGGRTLTEMEDILYHRSGLLGVSGISADSRELLQSGDGHAREAVELFTFRIAGEVARLAATLGGLDAIVFTAGVGENQPQIRAEVCARLAWLGVDLDAAANAANATRISRSEGRVSAFVIPTDEEQIIAEETLSVMESVTA